MYCLLFIIQSSIVFLNHPPYIYSFRSLKSLLLLLFFSSMPQPPLHPQIFIQGILSSITSLVIYQKPHHHNKFLESSQQFRLLYSDVVQLNKFMFYCYLHDKKCCSFNKAPLTLNLFLLNSLKHHHKMNFQAQRILQSQINQFP